MSTIWDLIEKVGTFLGGWQYNEPNLTYNQLLDPDSGNVVYYNGLGLGQTWTLENKN